MIERIADEWRDCQMRVSALEREYADAMAAYCRGEGPEPPDALHQNLLRMRDEARQLLAAALAEIDRHLKEQDRKIDGY